MKQSRYNPTQHKHAVNNSLAHQLGNAPLDKLNIKKEYKQLTDTAKMMATQKKKKKLFKL